MRPNQHKRYNNQLVISEIEQTLTARNQFVNNYSPSLSQHEWRQVAAHHKISTYTASYVRDNCHNLANCLTYLYQTNSAHAQYLIQTINPTPIYDPSRDPLALNSGAVAIASGEQNSTNGPMVKRELAEDRSVLKDENRLDIENILEENREKKTDRKAHTLNESREEMDNFMRTLESKNPATENDHSAANSFSPHMG